jgi:hypothetical protein
MHKTDSDDARHCSIDPGTGSASHRDDLLAEILAFVDRWNIGEAQFGKLAAHSQQLIYSLRRGRKCRSGTEARIREFMAKGDPGLQYRRRPATNQYYAAMRRDARAEQAASEFRRTDPVERAKTFIRSRGWHCFEAAITRPEHQGKFFIGAMLVTRDELLEFALRKGWAG